MSTSRETANPEAGFTLIETLVAMVVLTFGLIAITNLFVVAASSNSVANHGTAAAAEASEVMERLKALPFADLTAGGDLDSDLPSECDATTTNCVVGAPAPIYNLVRPVEGVGIIRVRWTIQIYNVPGPPSRFIRVRAQSEAPLAGARSRAEFTVLRSCTLPQTPNGPCPLF